MPRRFTGSAAVLILLIAALTPRPAAAQVASDLATSDRAEPEALSASPGFARRELRPDEPGLHGTALLLPGHAGPDWLR